LFVFFSSSSFGDNSPSPKLNIMKKG